MRRIALIRWGGLALALVATCLVALNCTRKKHTPPAACPPEITQVSPDTGLVTGGDTVTIRTSCFRDDFTANIPEVYFGTTPLLVTPADSTTLTVISPAHPVAEAVDVEVRGTGFVDSAILPAGFLYTALPPSVCTITGLAPSQGSTLGGESVTIDGADFDTPPLPAPTVEFGVGNPSPSVTVIDSTQLQVVTPSGLPGTVDVLVNGQPGVCSYPGGFEYLTPIPCTVTAGNPSQGYRDVVTTVFVDGADFDLPPLPPPTVEFGTGNFGTNVSVIRSDRLVVEAPTAALAGSVDVIVTVQTGPCTLSGGYEYLDPAPPPACQVATVDPAVGPDAGGNEVTLYGTGFTPVTRVWLGAAEAAAVQFASAGEVRFTAPPGAGTVGVTVDIGGGTTCALPSCYTFVPCGGTPCQISSVSPGTGVAGDTVTIQGTQLEDQAVVLFGTAPDQAQATTVDYSGVPTQLTVVVPPQVGSIPVVDVEVVNPSGSCCADPGAFTYTGCLIQTVFPDIGTEWGGTTVRLTGEGFKDGSGPTPEVWFGTQPCSIVIPLTTTDLIVQSPPALGQTTVTISVVYPTGEVCFYNYYTYHRCVIDSIVPASGGTNGGDVITIRGYGFDPTRFKVQFGAVYAHPDFITVDPTGTEMTLISPPSLIGGPVDVEIMTEGIWTTCTSLGGFTYILPGTSACSITDITPNVGWASGGETVMIRGSGFDAETGVIFGETPSPLVTYVGPDEILAETPTFTGPMTPIPVPVDVVVAPQGSDPCILPGGFSYVFPTCPLGCDVTAATPNSGPVGGGNTVTITGVNFCDQGTKIYFELEEAQATWVNDTTITAVVPASVTGLGAVGVSYEDGAGCSVACDGCYTYN